MSAHQAVFPIVAMARVLGVSRAGYYAWLEREPSSRARADAALLKRIRTVYAVSRGTPAFAGAGSTGLRGSTPS